MHIDYFKPRYYWARFVAALSVYSRLAGIGALVGVVASVCLSVSHGLQSVIIAAVLVCAVAATISIADPGLIAALKNTIQFLHAPLRSEQERLMQSKRDALLVSIEVELAKQSLEIERLSARTTLFQDKIAEELRSFIHEIHSDLVIVSDQLQRSKPLDTSVPAESVDEQMSANIQKMQSAASLFAQKVDASLAETRAQIIEQLKALNDTVLAAEKWRGTSSDLPEQTKLEFLGPGQIASTRDALYDVFLSHAGGMHVPLTLSLGFESEFKARVERAYPQGFPISWHDPYFLTSLEPREYVSYINHVCSQIIGQRLGSHLSWEISGTFDTWAKEENISPELVRLWANVALMLVKQGGGYESALAALEEALKGRRKSR